MSASALKICNNCGRKFFSPEDFLSNTSRWRICESGHLWFNCQCNSTNMIIKGKFDWYDPNQRLSRSAQSIFNSIPAIKQLPRIPSYVMELQTSIQEENTSAVKLASLAKHDPLLASQILKLANNLMASRGTRIESLAHAITVIGLKSLNDLVILAAVSKFTLSCKSFQVEQFWEHSFLVGRLAEFLGKRYKADVLSDEIYIAGSVCNIGKIVLAMCLPQIADKYSAEMENLKILGTWTAAESRNAGYPHTVLGEIGAMFWGLPEHVSDAIASHHTPPIMNSSMPFNMGEIVGFANQLAHWIVLQPNRMDLSLYKQYRARFKLDEKQTENLVCELMEFKQSAA